MGEAAIAFNALSQGDRIALLVELGFDDPQRYALWDIMNTRYECMLYDVQCELDRCRVRGKWVRVPPSATKVKPAKQAKVDPRRAEAVAQGLSSLRKLMP